MKPLLVLVAVFGISCFTAFITHNGTVNYKLSGCIAMAAMMAFTSIAYFVYWRGMVLMLPQFLPGKKVIVYLTGVIELLLAAGLLFSDTKALSGILLIFFFIAILPANIIDAQKHVNMEKADYTGHGLAYLWFRIPLQLLFIGWVYWCAL